MTEWGRLTSNRNESVRLRARMRVRARVGDARTALTHSHAHSSLIPTEGSSVLAHSDVSSQDRLQ